MDMPVDCRLRNSLEDSPSPPPPPPPPRRDKDSTERNTEYRRRRSSRSSHYSHHDRRHSPPPSFKRFRRDDGGYDRRRGSPRGGYGSDDRWHEYDSDYFDERSHGRYTDRSSDSDLGCGGIGDGSISQREGLMSYKQFIQELEDDILPASAERRYSEYLSGYISTQKRAYFENHKDEEWLKDKYHPTNLVTVIERRNECARATAKEFLLNLQSGTLDVGPGLTALLNRSGHGNDLNSADEPDTCVQRRRHGRGPAKENGLLSAALKAHPVSSEPRRIQIDIEQAQALVGKLDTEKGIEVNVLCGSGYDKFEGEKSSGGSIGPIIRGLTTAKGLEGVELLDTLITYLWRIHGLDYYGMSEINEAKGLWHVRAGSKTYNGSNMSGDDWGKKLDSYWQERLCGQDPLEIMTAKEKIDAAAVEVLDPYVRKINDEKYGCGYGCGAMGCRKLFHAAEFVHKHLRLKHPDLVMELTSKVCDNLYFQNYMNDANAPGGTPVMQQSAPKRKAPRRRPISDNRLRGGCGSRREHDRTDRVNDEDSPLVPFVPAPAEVARHMLREQGDPSSLEENGSPLGRKGRFGQQVVSLAPILAKPPAFQQDPRQIRSYHDLDALEDEVTVIDYRSL